jgi:branched-chain amino acid transport system ATP-binding protein
MIRLRRRPSPTGAGGDGAVIAAEGLSLGYGPVPVVHDVTMHVGRGELVALLGANGVGKTTTLLGLAGVLSPLKGTTALRGRVTTEPLHRRARSGLAYIAEERTVSMGLTVRDNFRVAGSDIDRATELFPELGDHLGRRVGLLSGGQQQMVGVALALARRPEILIADELSLGLAPIIVDRLVAALRKAADEDGVGVLLVEQHVRKALAAADRAYIMRRGRIALEGTGQELKARVGEVEASYLSATSGSSTLAPA